MQNPIAALIEILLTALEGPLAWLDERAERCRRGRRLKRLRAERAERGNDNRENGR